MPKSNKNNTSNGEYNKPFATRLRNLIDESEVSQAALAEHIGVTRQAISSYTLGLTLPDIEKFQKIADYFNVSYDYLLGKSESKQREYIDIGEKLGLSDEAIDNIIKINSYSYYLYETSTKRSNIILNLLLEDLFFYETINDMAFYIKCKTEYENKENSNNLNRNCDDLINKAEELLKDSNWGVYSNFYMVQAMEYIVKKQLSTSVDRVTDEIIKSNLFNMQIPNE